jgi:hypothetical protein
MSILNWYENFQEHEIPDENLWDDGEAIDLHFKAVYARREDGMGGGDDSTPSDDEMMGNEIASVFKN